MILKTFESWINRKGLTIVEIGFERQKKQCKYIFHSCKITRNNVILLWYYYLQAFVFSEKKTKVPWAKKFHYVITKIAKKKCNEHCGIITKRPRIIIRHPSLNSLVQSAVENVVLPLVEALTYLEPVTSDYLKSMEQSDN